MGSKKANFFERILWKLHIKKPNYNLTQVDRDAALALKQKRASIKIKRLEVEEHSLNKEIAALNKESPEEKMSKVFDVVINQLMQGGFNTTPQTKPEIHIPDDFNFEKAQVLTPPQNPKYEDVTEQEIRNKLSQLDPSAIQFLKQRPDADLKFMAAKELGLSGHNVEKAIAILRSM